ncbi:hypothetical protein DFA_08404 [Cavenderia fasciculata]|uniref:Pre-rRNA-processing protein RIX1 N-terminal domain-containing protein n=1 Tax=Cavenderia fasciculata TaxID=261658 RepID=F4Q600_CACFS|nr:uncharacterized protein DFA_08404 [Cavenderia fasciculata]EGG17409.1 hypothetical protein DFA_08404 [Cavenderia fasciculata]|eukprot:XP_004355893.1 hypothetical protein DFA_08404 [Cavenderia fasciculata]
MAPTATKKQQQNNANNNNKNKRPVETTPTINKVKKVKSSNTSTSTSTKTTTFDQIPKIQNNLEIIKDIIDQYFESSQQQSISITKDIESTIVQLLHHNQCLCKVLNVKENNKIALKWVQSIASMIRNKEDKNVSLFGLTMLVETIRIANYELMVEYQNQWCTLLTEAATDATRKGTAAADKYQLVMVAMSLLVDKSALWNDTRRSITSNNTINSFITSATAPFTNTTNATNTTNTTSSSNAEKLSGVLAICSFIDSLDASIKPFVGRLEVIAYSLLFGSDSQLSEAATSLISRLPKCIGVSAADIYWGVSLNKIITSMDVSVDRLFKGIPSDKSNLVQSRVVLLPKNAATGAIEGNDQLNAHLTHLINIATPALPTTPSQITEQETRSFQNLTSCLSSILTTSTLTACQLPIDRIIKLISRILNIGFTQISSNPYNDFTLIQQVSIITKLHCSSYQLLSILFKVLRKAMVPFIKTLSSTLLRPLRVMESYTNLKIQKDLFETIKDAIEAIGASCSDSLAVPLVPILLKQILPYIPEQQQAAIQEKKTKKKGAQPEAQMTGPAQQQTVGNVDATKIHDGSDHQLRVSALQVLESLLINAGSLLGSSVRTQIDSTIVSLVMHCQTLLVKKLIFVNSSYQCDTYRSLLYSCMLQLAIKPISGIPPVLPYTIRLMSNGASTDNSPQVRSTCIQGVSICESIIHPQCPNLQAPTIHSNLSSLKKSINQYQLENNNSNNNNNHFFNQQQQEQEIDQVEQDEQESGSDEESGSVSDDDEKLDISLNDIDDEDEEDEEEEEETIISTTSKTTTTTTSGMKSGLFNDLSFNSATSASSKNNNNKKQQQQQQDISEDEDEDLDFDIVDESPSEDEN